ncbi:MAG: dienelactone hydrolase family protein [Firmicutes bacterium]|nr:dienelactone hydrolase family protein [Bacillota bacterium]
MKLHTEWVRYGNEGQYVGLLQKPSRADGPLPVVIVIQEIWGVDDHIEDVARRFAEAGYVSFAPDLYAVDGKRPTVLAADRVEAVKAFLDTMPSTAWHSPEARQAEMDKLPEAERGAIQETFATLFGGLQMDRYTGALTAASSFLRDQCEHTKGQGVVSVGFCMGGALSALLACLDPQLAGAAIFYGNAPAADRLHAIACPVRGFYGALDGRITDAVPEFAMAMETAGKDFAYTVYEGAQHAFFNDTRKSYQVTAARDAFAQTLAFFRAALDR